MNEELCTADTKHARDNLTRSSRNGSTPPIDSRGQPAMRDGQLGGKLNGAWSYRRDLMDEQRTSANSLGTTQYSKGETGF